MQRALAGEHAAVYAYGVVGARLAGAGGALARAGYSAHQAARDAVAGLLRAANASPVAAQPGYLLPSPVDTPAAAIALAVLVETRLAVSYDAVIGTTDAAALRRFAVTALTATATRAAQWRLAAHQPPYTAALPGR